MSDEQHAAFLRGFNLARPPGPGEADALEADALEVAEEVMPSEVGQLRVSTCKVSVSLDQSDEILVAVDRADAQYVGP